MQSNRKCLHFEFWWHREQKMNWAFDFKLKSPNYELEWIDEWWALIWIFSPTTVNLFFSMAYTFKLRHYSQQNWNLKSSHNSSNSDVCIIEIRFSCLCISTAYFLWATFDMDWSRSFRNRLQCNSHPKWMHGINDRVRLSTEFKQKQKNWGTKGHGHHVFQSNG